MLCGNHNLDIINIVVQILMGIIFVDAGLLTERQEVGKPF
jgi:hypothetical protein